MIILVADVQCVMCFNVGIQLDEEATSILNQLQQSLNVILDELSVIFANRSAPHLIFRSFNLSLFLASVLLFLFFPSSSSCFFFSAVSLALHTFLSSPRVRHFCLLSSAILNFGLKYFFHLLVTTFTDSFLPFTDFYC